MDISADLTELSRTPVVVLSAGIKSILDIKRTLEVLETMAVPTVSYRTDEFPAFFSPHSGVKSPARMDSPEQVAEAYWAARDLGLSSGMLVAIPNDDPAGDNVERAIQKALQDAEKQGIEGQAVTPFVLRQVALDTGGDSLRSNMSLVRNNARIGAEVAIEISKRRRGSHGVSSSIIRSRVVVLGGTVMDIVARPNEGKELLMGTSNPGLIIETDGGVGRNVAEALGRLGSKPYFCSAVGNDSRGYTLVGRLQDECGVSPDIAIIDNANTATYLAVLNGWGDMHTAVADMAVLESVQPPPIEALQQAEFLVVDANPPISTLIDSARNAVEYDVKVAFEPTSVPKARMIAKEKELLSCFTFIFPNIDELMAMADVLPDSMKTIDHSSPDAKSHIRTACQKVLSCMRPEAYLIVTMGDKGVLLASRAAAEKKTQFREFPPKEKVTMSNATGAGDSLCGAFVHAILHGKPVEDAVSFGMDAAVLSLHCSSQAISPELSTLRMKGTE
jgi:pseudouridine-5'-phosphate glycosidase/pseudouridine kinase